MMRNGSVSLLFLVALSWFLCVCEGAPKGEEVEVEVIRIVDKIPCKYPCSCEKRPTAPLCAQNSHTFINQCFLDLHNHRAARADDILHKIHDGPCVVHAFGAGQYPAPFYQPDPYDHDDDDEDSDSENYEDEYGEFDRYGQENFKHGGNYVKVALPVIQYVSPHVQQQAVSNASYPASSSDDPAEYSSNDNVTTTEPSQPEVELSPSTPSYDPPTTYGPAYESEYSNNTTVSPPSSSSTVPLPTRPPTTIPSAMNASSPATIPSPVTTAPVIVTAPVVVTSAPVVVTSAPVVTTPSPVTATPVPVVVTSAPVVVTATPVMTTPSPVTATPGPVTQTSPPVTIARSTNPPSTASPIVVSTSLPISPSPSVNQTVPTVPPPLVQGVGPTASVPSATPATTYSKPQGLPQGTKPTTASKP